jgi:hypothetical protein
MSKRVSYIFALVINFLGVDRQLKHIIIGLFKASETIGQFLAKNSITLLDEYGFFLKIVVYVQYEGLNLNVMLVAHKSMVSCDILGLDESF